MSFCAYGGGSKMGGIVALRVLHPKPCLRSHHMQPFLFTPGTMRTLPFDLPAVFVRIFKSFLTIFFSFKCLRLASGLRHSISSYPFPPPKPVPQRFNLVYIPRYVSLAGRLYLLGALPSACLQLFRRSWS